MVAGCAAGKIVGSSCRSGAINALETYAVNSAVRYAIDAQRGPAALQAADDPAIDQSTENRNIPFTLPDKQRTVLADMFNVPVSDIDQIKLEAYSDFAVEHFAYATTRVNAIYVNDSSEGFLARPLTVLEEFYHVLQQWNTGKMTLMSYAWESMKNGYDNNKYEIEAKTWAKNNAQLYRDKLKNTP